MPTSNVKSVNALQAAQWLRTGEAILIDVREPHEFSETHIPNAASVPLSLLPNQFDLSDVPEGRKVIFQCMKGARGARACDAVAASAGDRDIYNLEGGIQAWEAEKLPLIRPSGAKPALSIFRQVQIVVGSIILALILTGFAGATWAFVLAAIVSAMLAIAGVTGWCGMAHLLARMPWNRAA